jgi:hypothetical protein
MELLVATPELNGRSIKLFSITAANNLFWHSTNLHGGERGKTYRSVTQS